MDFDDLLLNWLLLLRQHDDVRRAARRPLRAHPGRRVPGHQPPPGRHRDDLLGGDRNLMVVGDDAQSIYSFRGAEIANILTFPCATRAARSSSSRPTTARWPPILALANASIAHNRNQFPKALRAVRDGGEQPAVSADAVAEAQAGFVAPRASSS